MSGIEDYFGAAGDMYSGSQNPDEQARKLEREAEKQRREQEKEQARLQREQQAQQAELQKSLQTSPQQTTPKPVVIENKEAILPKSDPDDPLDGVPDHTRTDILLHKYDDESRRLTDIFGETLAPDQRKEYIDSWKNRVKDASPDVRDILLQMNINHHPDMKDQAEQARREFQQWLPKPEAKTLELNMKDTNADGIARHADYRPERDGVAAVHKAIQYVNEPVSTVKANHSLLSQAASVNNPQDESMTPLYKELFGAFSNAFGKDKAVTGYGRSTVGHSDLSYGEAEKQAGRAVKKYVNKAVEPGSAIYGKDGNSTVGEPDQTTGSLIEASFQNMDHKTIAKAQQMINEAQGFKYDPEYGSQESYAFVKGMKMVPLEAKIGLYSLASLGGELLYSIVGGDPKGMRQAQQQLKQYQQQLDDMKPMKLDQIVDPNHPENTSRNLTLYLYQNLGNQLVKLPASVLLGKVDSIATLTGMSAATMTAKIHADLQRKTGDPHAVESMMYGIPLGMMTLLNIPFKVPASIKTPDDVKKWATSMLVDFGVGELKDVGADYTVHQYENIKKDDKDPPPQ